MQNASVNEARYEFQIQYDNAVTTPPPTKADAARQVSNTIYSSHILVLTVENQSESQQLPLLSPLCKACATIFTGKRKDRTRTGLPHSLGLTILQQELNASQGCHLCRIRHAQITRDYVPNLSRLHAITYGYYANDLGHRIDFEYTTASTISNLTSISVAFVDDEPFPLSLQGSLARRIECGVLSAPSETLYSATHSSNSPSSFNIMRDWITDCEEKHTICRQLESDVRNLPTRLVCIGDDVEVIRPSVFSRLLLSNEAAFQNRLPVSELSKTFTDAMEVTRRLGICYIWIDSLCIVQDSDEDWRHEASRMGEVYRGSYCNIAATAAKDGRDGLFTRRTLLDVEPCQVKPSWAESPNRSYFCVPRHFWRSEVQETPLLARAWVSQELILARRTLHFSRTQVWWECLERRACETYPDKIPNDILRKPSLHPVSLGLDSTYGIYDDSFISHELWMMVVRAYSFCELTYKTKDKLLAVSGLAQNIGLPFETYLAGLWRQGLEQQLLWHVHRGVGSHKAVAPGTYRAPTWSWAAIDGPVKLTSPTLRALQHPCVDILNAETELVDLANPFGQIRSGYLRLRCMIARAYLAKCNECNKSATAGKYLESGKEITAVLFDLSDSSRVQAQQHLAHPDAIVIWDRGEPVFEKVHYLLLLDREHTLNGLVVGATERSNGQYERLGYFSVGTPAHNDSDLRFLDMCRRPLDDEKLYESMSIDKRSEMPSYVVTLI
ncbi:hypothetical protein LTS10_001923 [Elasticomyces elasticus]|nr:hypothetical protein LTS10_001923 [Elasticomyces elasticus]